MHRLRRLGLQKRIMLYVTVGLALLFGLVAFVGLGATEQATQLVYQERLTTAYTTAGIIARDFDRVAGDVEEAASELRLTAGVRPPPGTARKILGHFTAEQAYPFFRVAGVWIVDDRGNVVDEAGDPSAVPPNGPSPAAAELYGALSAETSARYAVLRAAGTVPGAVAFASVAVRVGDATGPPGTVVAIHTVSINAATSYVPAAYGRPGPADAAAEAPQSATESYHLEIIDPDGMAVLGVGEDERPGSPSVHFSAVGAVMRERGAAALLHEPGPGDRFEPHVMAVVPIPQSPFYVVLEQPVDVALELPLQLRQRLIVLITLGFLATLVVAWITTRHVVKPTEELTAAAERMARGDLASPIEISAQDEVGKLAESFEAMRQRLGAAYEAAERTNRELETRVAERTARLEQVLRVTISAQEDERLRLARELHDETAQTIAALSVALDRARDELDGGPSPAVGQILEAKGLAGRLLTETRRLILGLRPAVLDDLGLIPAVRWHCDAYLAQSDVEPLVEGEAPAVRLPGHVEVALFRIIQEAVSNVARHAMAQHLWIRFAFDEATVKVSVVDDGRGFDVEGALNAPTPHESVGLLGMLERVALLGGRMEIQAQEGRGTQIQVEVPIPREAR